MDGNSTNATSERCLPGLPGTAVQMPGFSLALSEVVSDLWQPNPADVMWVLGGCIRCSTARIVCLLLDAHPPGDAVPAGTAHSCLPLPLPLPCPPTCRAAGVKWALVFTGIGVGSFLLETVEVSQFVDAAIQMGLPF